MANPDDGSLAAKPLATPGPLGRDDAADPDAAGPRGAAAVRTPGPLGVDDAVAPDPPPSPVVEEQLAHHAATEAAVIERINGFIDEAFRHDERVAEMLEAAGPDEQARVRRELSLPASGEVLAPPSKYLEKALALATAARKRDSLDPVLRDAQYYLHTRSRVASSPGLAKPFTAMAGGAFAVLWDFAKWVLPEGVEAALMQKDPDRPNSPPGGWVWGVLGCSDGLLDLERDRGRPRHAKRTPREELRMMLQGHAAAARWAAPR